jgi:hypothetical protein
MERIVELEEKIKRMQEDMERFGEEGAIDEAKEVSEQIEAATASLNNLRQQEEKDRRTVVCDVCGALLAVNDAPERIEAHMVGKQHTGYQKLRDIHAKLKVR